MNKNTENKPLDPVAFNFWYAPEGMTLTTDVENREINVAKIPLPIRTEDMLESSDPSEKVMGDGIYEYLCRFPSCRHADEYAKILQQAYPFLISDIGSQLILLDVKNVEPSGLERKIALLKILQHLDPDSFGLLHKIGIAHFDLGLHYSVLTDVKAQMKEARSWLEKARRQVPDNLNNLNYLGQVCYLNGTYHQAKLYWQIAAEQLDEGESREELTLKLGRIISGDVPEQPLVDSLEAVGIAMEHFNAEDYPESCDIMERLVAVGSLPTELPNPEFFLLLGLCREKCDDISGAFEAFSMATQLDKKHQAAQAALKRITQTNARS